MNLLGLAQRLADAFETTISIESERCLHSLDKFSDCQACFDLCPTPAGLAAIQPGAEAGQPPALSAENCVRCRACLPVCPAGAYRDSGLDPVEALQRSLPGSGASVVELICSLNPNVAEGLAGVELAVRLPGCLAGLAVGDLLALAVSGPERLILRDEACQDCPWGRLRPQVEELVKQARSLLSLWNRQDALDMAGLGTDDEAHERPFWAAGSPPRSRRALFQMAAGPPAASPTAGAGREERPTEGRPALPGRLRFVGSVLKLGPPEYMVGDAHAVAPGFGLVSISDTCTACGACARACPTGALSFHAAAGRFELRFSPLACIGCDICRHVCAPQAVELRPDPPFRHVFGSDSEIVVREGPLASCTRCRAPFAAREGQRLCPTCDYRRRNPFGSYLPPHLEHVLEKRRSRSEP